MNHASNSNAGSDHPELNISIAGSSHDGMAAALDEAVARLNMVAGGLQPGLVNEELHESTPPASADAQPSPAPDVSVMLKLIESICRAHQRRDALVELVTFLDTQLNDCLVRGAIGHHTLHQIHDPRLGWLGAESSLLDQYRKRWTTLDPKSKAAADKAANRSADHQPGALAWIQKTDDRTLLVMNSPDGLGRCVVWIDGPSAQRQSVEWLDQVAGAIGIALWSRPGRSWPMAITRMIRRQSLVLGIAGLLLAAAAIWPVSYRVGCTAVVETAAQRLVAAPFEATLEKAFVRPGDIVRRGDLLLTLDGRPLRIEREAIAAERQQVAKERDSAMATGRIADSQQATLKKRQLTRRYELLTDRLANLDVVSPIDGVVVSGDLERFVGSPLDQGQTLMEIAPMNRMVIELEIPEHEIGYLEPDTEARVKIDALGGKSIWIPIHEIYPRAEVRDDQNVFIAKIKVDNADRALKPGMRGKATAYGPLRPWIWSWVRGGYEQILWWIGY